MGKIKFFTSIILIEQKPYSQGLTKMNYENLKIDPKIFFVTKMKNLVTKMKIKVKKLSDQKLKIFGGYILSLQK